MKHTFIICAYKESPFLELCIESCLQQTSVANKQSIVAIYTSTPNEFILRLGEKYDLSIYTKEGGGIGIDWNNALSFVDTDYATIVHQDDIYLPEYGSRVIESFERKKEANIVFSDYLENDASGQVKPRNINLKIKTAALRLMSLSNNKFYQRRIYAMGNFISCPAVSYNLSRLNGFRFDERLKMTLDWDAWERIMKIDGTVQFIDEKLMYHRIHEDSETTANTVDKTRELEEYDMYRRYWGKNLSKLIMKFYVLNQKSNKV